MITVTADYKTAALANYRDPRARVRVTWESTVTNPVLTAVSADENRGSIIEQLHDDVLFSSYKWAYCSTGSGTGELIADGSFHPMPSDTTSGQVGWFSSVASDASGEWVTDPLVTYTFTTTPFIEGAIRIHCDTQHNEYPEDFTIRLYKDAALLHTEVVTGNTDTDITAELTGVSELEVNKLTVEINKWGTAYGIVKIVEIGFAVSEIYYGDKILALEILEEMEADEGSLPIGNISCNELNLTLSNDDNRFSYGNTNSPLNNLIKKDRKIEVWLGFVLPSESSDVSSGTYIVETISGDKIGFMPYGVYWSDDWVTDTKSVSVSTFARDRLDLFRQLIYDDSDLHANISLADLANEVMTSINNKTLDVITWGIDATLSSIQIPYGYFEKKTYFEVLKDIAVAGITTVYADRTGKVIIGRFPYAPSSSPTEATWSQSVIYDLKIVPKTEEISNYVDVKAQSLVMDSATSSVYSSDDQITIPLTDPGGVTWTIRSSAADNQWVDVIHGNGLFVAVADTGTGNRVMTSPDGITWTIRSSAADNNWNGVTYGNGLFVAVANSGAGNRVMTSSDGITWTIRSSAADNSWVSVTYGNGLFVAVAQSGTGNRVMTSPDGINWTVRSSAADNAWYGVAYGNNIFVTVAYTGTGNRVMTSPDGINWTIRSSAVDNQWVDVTYGNGLFVAVAQSGTGNRVMTSPDGINWTIRSSAADRAWLAVTYGNDLFVAVSQDGTGDRVMTSPDGITWTTRSSAADNNWHCITYGNGRFVAAAVTGTGNRVMTSPDKEAAIASTTMDITLTWDNVPVDPSTVVTTVTDVTGTTTISTEDYYTWGGYVTLAGNEGNVFTLSTIGKVVLVQSETKYVAQDSDSITQYGRRVYEIADNHLIQNYSSARQIGDNLLPTYKDIRKDASVSLPANTIVELSDPILVTEYKDDVLTTNSYFYIIRQTISFNGSLDSSVELRRFI